MTVVADLQKVAAQVESGTHERFFFIVLHIAREQDRFSVHRHAEDERIVVVAMEPKERIAPTLARYMSQKFYVAIDPSGRIFSAYGIRYVPFGVLIDRKGRACWIGNPMLATEKIIRDNLK